VPFVVKKSRAKEPRRGDSIIESNIAMNPKPRRGDTIT